MDCVACQMAAPAFCGGAYCAEEAGRLNPMATKTKPTKSATTKLRPVLVTTANRGVFFGYASKTDGDTIKLRDARNCLYWSKQCGGFMGLAANGPVGDSRVGAKADIEIRNITSVSEVAEAAAKVWNDKPVWK